MIEIGSNDGSLKIGIVEAADFKGMNNRYELEKFRIIGVRITAALQYLEVIYIYTYINGRFKRWSQF